MTIHACIRTEFKVNRKWSACFSAKSGQNTFLNAITGKHTYVKSDKQKLRLDLI